MFSLLVKGLVHTGACILLCMLPVIAAIGGVDSASINSLNTIPAKAQKSDSVGNGSERSMHDSAAVITLDKMVVSANKHQRLLETTQSFAIIKPEEWAGTAKSIADIIAVEPGVQTRRYGGLGSFQSVSIRGIQGSEVLVLLDGVPLNSAMGGAVDLGKINPMQLQEIELYKGTVPGALGGNSIGGVINLRTRPAAKAESVDLQTTIGSFSTQEICAAAYRTFTTRFSVFGGASYAHSQNDFPYLDRNNTLYGPSDGSANDPRSDDTVRTMRNNQFTSFEATIHPALKLPGAGKTIAGGAFFSTATHHVPAPEGKENETANYREERIVTSLSLQNDKVSPVSLTPRISYSRCDGVTAWTNKDEGFGTSHGGVSRYGRAGIVDQSLHFDLELQTRIAERIGLLAMAFARAFDANPRYDRDGSIHGDWHSRSAQGGAAVDCHIEAGLFTISAGGSVKGIYDETEGGLDALSNHQVVASDTITALWSAASGISLRPMENLMFFLNAGRYGDEPSLRERYGAKGAISANPELKPETGYSFEYGVKAGSRRLYIECAGFYVRSMNSIVFDFDGYQLRPVNNEGARNFGVEVKADAALTGRIDFMLAATWQKTENLQRLYEKNRLPDEPDLTVNPGIDIRPFTPLTLSYTPTFKSFYYHDRANTAQFRVPVQVTADSRTFGHAYHNFLAVWKATRQLECRWSVQNVTFRRLDSPGAVVEGGYSWVLYPVNEWRVTMKYSF